MNSWSRLARTSERCTKKGYKTSLKSGDSYISCLNAYKKGVKLVFEQDIYRASDNALATKGIVESVIVENGKLTRGEYFDEMLKRIEHT